MTAIKKAEAAKSSAAPAQLNFRNLRRELIDEIAAMSDDQTLHPENFHEQAGQLIADHAKAYARAAHQALYEALSAARDFCEQAVEHFQETYSFIEEKETPEELFERFEDSGYASAEGEICRLVGQLKKSAIRARAALALADAAQGEK